MFQDQPSRTIFMTFVILFAVFMFFLLFAAVRSVRADVIRPNVDDNIISIGAYGVGYDASSGILTISDDTAAFTYRPDSVLHFIYNLSGNFGGSYLLRALFDSTGSDAPLDGLFTTVGDETPDLIITGEIPSLNITVANGYTGTLLKANVRSAELFAYGSSNPSAEFNLWLEVVGGDLVRAGEYDNHMILGGLSALNSLNPELPSGFAFDSDFTSTFQSGTIGIPVPEPASLTVMGMGALGLLGFRRLTTRRRS